MRHLVFGESETFNVAILIKASSFKQGEILSNYVEPLVKAGIPRESIIAFTLDYNDIGKAPAKFMKDYLSKLIPALKGVGVTHILCADSAYFKALTKSVKTEPHMGYVLDCKVDEGEGMKVVLSLNYQGLIYDPSLQTRLDMSINALVSDVQGNYVALGSNIIHSASYPKDTESIAAALQNLHKYKELTCDIEAFSLRFNEAGIGTIAFAWDEHNGIAFACDCSTIVLNDGSTGGHNVPNSVKRTLLKQFFEDYQGTLIFHNATYDIKVILYTLWMKDPLDTKGLLHGLEIMTRHFQDTKIIAYLATNSTAGNTLGLKQLAHEFAGNWAVEEITNICKIPLDELLQYNLVDCLSTWYVYKKHYPVMVADKQEDLYKDLMLPSLKTIIQMELTGMPMDDAKIQSTREELEATQNECLNIIHNSPIIKTFNLLIQQSAMEKANAKLKTKQHPLSKFADQVFNPGSPLQLQRLLYEQMGLPVLDYTDTKQPATGAETIEKLINHTEEPLYKEILEALIRLGKVDKILTAFIPAFEKGVKKADGMRYLHGSFNLGGTVSGRLSSSKPNMQNLPANSKYGKTIKKCFKAPYGWIFCGADFSSLEDRINALLTKDPAKLKVYTDGYDGHALRAYAYFGDEMPDIVETVESINSVAEKGSPYYHLRQESKSPTFALTYQGTWMTMVKNLGWSEEKAKKVEANYHKLYAASTAWVKARIAEAAELGYSEAAFGLRIRTPLLAQTILGKASTPKEAEAEARTLGNAISGQSYGLLNSRAMNVVMEKVRNSKFKYDILPVAQIHDACYYLIRDNVEVVEFANREITTAMAWQDLPEIWHDQVKLGAELDLFYPDWSNPITLPSDADGQQIKRLCEEAVNKLNSKP